MSRFQNLKTKFSSLSPLTRRATAAVAILLCLCIAGGSVFLFARNPVQPANQPEETSEKTSDYQLRESSYHFPELDFDSLPDYESNNFSISAKMVQHTGVAVASAFTLQCAKPEEMSKKRLEENLVFTPEVAFSVSKQKKDTYLVTPAVPLQEDTVYQVGLKEETTPFWAFQTETTFRVSSTIPYNGATDVPRSAGLEIEFNLAPVNPEKHIRIEPETKGEFLIYYNTVIFVPEKDFKKDCEYTVTISKNMSCELGDTLGEAHSFQFSTKKQTSPPISIYNFQETFLPGDPVVVQVGVNQEWMEDQEFDLNIYSLNGVKEYLNIADKYYRNGSRDELFAHQSKKPVMSFRSAVQHSYGRYASLAGFLLPKPLETGYYIVDTALDGTVLTQKIIQVSEIAVYYQYVRNEYLFWINDAATGKPVPGASVRMTGSKQVKAVTDKDGVAELRLPTNGKNAYEEEYVTIEISGNGKQYAETVSFWRGDDFHGHYYFYVYTDREQYRSTDTVRFWGIVRPRSDRDKLITSLQLSTPANIIEPQTVKVNPDGSFQGSFSFSNASSFEWRFESEGLRLDRYSYIYTDDSPKPKYVIEAAFDKPYYRAGETATVSVHASFYDGNPAPGITLEVNGTPLATNSVGDAAYRFVPTSSGESGRPEHTGVSIHVAGAEESQSSLHLQTILFPSDVFVSTSWDPADKSSELKIDAYEIDYEKLPVDYDPWTDPPKKKAADIKGTVTIMKWFSVRREGRRYYDFIKKEAVTIYTYDRNEEQVEEFSFKSTNGQFTRALPYQNTGDVSYHACISFQTPNGNFSQRAYLYSTYREYRDALYDFVWDSQTELFGEQESSRFTLRKNDKAVTKGSMLYTAVNGRLAHRAVTKSGAGQIPFSEGLVNRFTLTGAYFDGRHIFTVNQAYREFDLSLREAKITLTPDKKSYRPGEKATVKVKVTDTAGKGLKASAVLSVVDEAAFSDVEQRPDPLSLYWQSYSYVYSTCSYVDYSNLIGADGTGGSNGGGGYIRRNFVDTAAFLPVTTGQNGETSVTFNMPDNMTSWRLTCVAVSQGAKPRAGYSKEHVICTQGMYINEIHNSRLTVNDDLSVSLRCAGGKVKPGDAVDYTIICDGKTTKLSGKAGTPVYVNLGKQAAGKHTITLKAKSAAGSDAMEISTEVLGSLRRLSLCEWVDLKDGIQVKPSLYPVRMTFYDKAISAYLNLLYFLESDTALRRDNELAAHFARVKRAELSQEVCDPIFPQRLDGVRSVPWSEADPLLTGKALLSMKNYMETDGCRRYLYDILENRDFDANAVAAAYMGLCALGEPVLSQATALLDSPHFNLRQKQLIAAGIAAVGDRKTAAAWYKKNMEPSIREILQKNPEKSKYGVSAYALVCESAALAVVSRSKDLPAILRYITQEAHPYDLPCLDVMAAVELMGQPSRTESAFRYQLWGETIQADFEKQLVHSLSVGEEAFRALGAKLLRGDISVMISYTGNPKQYPAQSQYEGTVTRSLSPASAKPGEEIIVTLTIKFREQAPKYFQINEVLPTGMRYAGLVAEYGYRYASEQNGNLNLFVRSEGSTSVTLQYRLRCLLPGEYGFEGSLVTADDGLVCAGKAQQIGVGE